LPELAPSPKVRIIKKRRIPSSSSRTKDAETEISFKEQKISTLE